MPTGRSLESRSDTIAAIATPPGSGGVAIVRVSGRNAAAVVAKVFRGTAGAALREPRRVYFGRVLDRPGGDVLDEVIAFSMRAPYSYTGEDVVEIQCHGGSLLSQRVLESICAAGARPASPGEFTKRAFLNGKLDLAQAEAIADLIGARTEAGRRMAWSQLDGQLSVQVSALRETIVKARALSEAALDFADEDIAEITVSDLGRELDAVRAELEKLTASFERARVRYEGARVAVVGRPNVGKSSLLNALSGRDRALVTAIAGTTRDVIEVAIAVDGIPIVLMDTAGFRETSDEIEALGISRSRAAIAESACVLAIFDRTAALGTDDRMVADAVRGRSAVAVLNKSDLPSEMSVWDVRALLGDVPVIEASAVRGDGIVAVTSEIGRVLAGGGTEPDDEVVIYRVRHRDAVCAAMRHVEEAVRALADDHAFELVASDLSAAAASLDDITGPISNEDVLDRVFAEFCIGK